MTRICPRCGNQNNDGVNFCTSCGNPLASPAFQSDTIATPSRGTMSPAASPGPKSTFKIIALAAVAIIVIVTALFLLQAAGIVRIFPFLSQTGTPRITPVVTSYVIVDTPLPETPPATVLTVVVTSITASPVPSPTPPPVIICPSDRRACNTNCTDILTDRSNCGACGVPCNFSQICRQGMCMETCPTDQASCFNGCHNLSYDAQNCGACGNSCPVGLACNKSVCAPTLPTTIPTYAG
jgi:hypothetical protein